MSSDTRDEYPPELLRELEAYELPQLAATA
jgi:hypothetical protein